MARLHDFDPNVETAFVTEIHRGLKRIVHDAAATIGFCGAPWTLATYAVEGGSTKSFATVKAMMHREPKLLEALLAKLADACGKYLAAQIEAGADVVQVFDSWAGELSRADYDRFARPATERLVSHLPRRSQVPVILFASGSAHLVDSFAADARRRPLHRLEAPARRGAEARERQGAAGKRRPRRPPRNAGGRDGRPCSPRAARPGRSATS